MMAKHSFCVNAKSAILAALLALATLAIPQAALAGQSNNKGGNSPQASTTAWQDDFNGTQVNSTFWVVANGQAPGYIANSHIGYYDPTHVKIVSDGTSSYLQLLLTQDTGTVGTNTKGTVSRGALIYSKNKYRYGTYEMRMRMSSTSAAPNGSGDSISGSVSAGFEYVNNSQTEIDFEFSALFPDTLYMVNWYNTKPHSAPTSDEETYSTLYPLTVSTDFHTYKFVWQPGQITFYVDDVQQAVHTTDVPSAAAYFMINHWGTNSNGWGGPATTGVSRYFYVDWVRFTPQ